MRYEGKKGLFAQRQERAIRCAELKNIFWELKNPPELLRADRLDQYANYLLSLMAA